MMENRITTFTIKPLKFECNQFNEHKATKTEKEENLRASKRYDNNMKEVKSVKQYRYYKTFTLFKKKEIELSNLNIFVGDNGVGKTTLIKEITRGYDKVLNLGNLSKDGIRNSFSQLANDSYFKAGSKDYVNNIMSFYFSNNSSNGEVILATLNDLETILDVKGLIIIFDEPETSISLKNQIRLRNYISKLSENNQIFLSTHSPVFMELSDVVFDVEKLKWTNRKNYLKNILK